MQYVPSAYTLHELHTDFSSENCDAIGHMSKECEKPKDWSRVTCNNCGQIGHGVKRCPEPIKEVEAEDTGAGGDWGNGGAATGNDGGATDGGAGGWGGGEDVPATTGGGGW